MNSFEADFQQKITDDKNATLTYKGHIQAKKPQYALWEYKEPVEKSIYITSRKVTIIEPELEQVIIKYISSDFDFFSMMQHAKKIDENSYLAHFKEVKYKINVKDGEIISISYRDEFDNSVTILFTNQVKNRTLKKELFEPKIPLDFDIIQG